MFSADSLSEITVDWKRIEICKIQRRLSFTYPRAIGEDEKEKMCGDERWKALLLPWQPLSTTSWVVCVTFDPQVTSVRADEKQLGNPGRTDLRTDSVDLLKRNEKCETSFNLSHWNRNSMIQRWNNGQNLRTKTKIMSRMTKTNECVHLYSAKINKIRWRWRP